MTSRFQSCADALRPSRSLRLRAQAPAGRERQRLRGQSGRGAFTAVPVSRRLRGVVAAVALVLGLLCRQPALVQAQDEPAAPETPLITINVASVERLLGQAVLTFEAAGRPELAETLGGALARVNDLNGLDRGQSMGIMLFLNGLTNLDAVAYVPVANLADLLKTAEIGPVTTRQTTEDSFEIVAGPRTLHGKVVGNYAFVADNAAAVAREFADPAASTRKLSTSYDIAATLNLRAIPKETREVFLSVMRANTEIGLQRRDTEPEAAHRIRKAAGLRNAEVIEQLLSQGEEVTIGWSVSGMERTAALEVVVAAAPDTDLAAYFNSLEGVRSRFASLLSATQPLTASVAWNLDKSARTMFHEIVSAVEARLAARLDQPAADSGAQGEGAGDSANVIGRLIQVLRATVDAGRLDFAAQFAGQPPGPFVLIGGLAVADSATLAQALPDLLARIRPNETLSKVQTNAASHGEIQFHRLDFARTDAPGRRLFGDEPRLYLGVGDSILWFAIGGTEAFAQLKRAIDKSAEPPAETAAAVPIQFVMNFSSWMDIFDPENRPGFAAMARDNFSRGGDALRIDARPIKDGMRLRLSFDEAFIRLVGEAIARRMDREAE